MLRPCSILKKLGSDENYVVRIPSIEKIYRCVVTDEINLKL